VGTSILKSLTPSFCDALLGIDNSSSILEDLERANLFVTQLTGEQRVYRYHSLFQEFLVGQFEPDRLVQKVELHRRAGDLLEQEGKAEQSIDHYLQAEAYREALRVIHVAMEHAYKSGRTVTVAGWLDALDPDVIKDDALACLMRGRAWRQQGNPDLALEWFHRADAIYERHSDLAGQSEVRVREAMVHRYRGEFEIAKEICKQVLGMPESPIETIALAHRILGECDHLAGELVSAKGQLRRSLKLYRQTGDDYSCALVLHALGTTARRMGNTLEADGHYRQALKRVQKLGNRWRVAEIKNNLGVGHYYQGEYQEALEMLGEALVEAREVGHIYTEALVLASLGDIHFELGNIELAHDQFQGSLTGAKEDQDLALQVYVQCALANLHRVDKAWDQSHALLEEAEEISSSRQSGYLQGLISMTRGMILIAEDRLQDAETELQSAYRLLQEAGAKRELARTLLWLAYAHFQLDMQESTLEYLSLATETSYEISHSHLLVQDGRRVLPMLEWAAKVDGDGKGELENLLTRIHQFTLTTLQRPEETVKLKQPRLEIRAFGEGDVKVNGKSIPYKSWGGPLVRELFFFLLENAPVRREVILGVFWPDYSLAKAKSVFHATLYRMRKVLPTDKMQKSCLGRL
jgi:ATP/maltotriose-dependent transcriptional regulator MalT